MTREASLPFHSWRLPMPSTALALQPVTNPASQYGRMCSESCPSPIIRSATSLQRLPEKIVRSNRQGRNGRTLVLSLDPKGQSRGGSLTPNGSDWPNDASVCTLSQVLVTGSIPERFFLSSTACEGILRRAEKRGKVLPKLLQTALEAVAYSPQAASEPIAAAAVEPCAPTAGIMEEEAKPSSPDTLEVAAIGTATNIPIQPSISPHRGQGASAHLIKKSSVNAAPTSFPEIESLIG